MLTFLAREQERVAARRHARLFPLLTEGIVILAIEVLAARRRHLRNHARTAQMVRHEIVNLGTRTIVCSSNPSPAERGTLELSVIVYQRTYVPLRRDARRTAHGQLRPIRKMGITA